MTSQIVGCEGLCKNFLDSKTTCKTQDTQTFDKKISYANQPNKFEFENFAFVMPGAPCVFCENWQQGPI